MKKLNEKMTIAQKGGLMIEALAMLGLIAVVTPTMYKKSAERTLEVEDINTATTMRTYLNAAEAYVNNNYADLVTQSEDNKEITAQLTKYLPYGYQNKTLYDFGQPKAFVHKQGMNLTAFVTFPAKAAGGLGKERTSRIASLIGSNGGYTTVDGSVEFEDENGEKYNPPMARGIGGIWTLKSGAEGDGDYDKIVGNVHRNSIVMASSSIINDISGEELESDKYLSRIPEDGHNADYQNTMRTDIYMGGMSNGETRTGYGYGRNSIRNIQSLIVGTDKLKKTVTDPETGETTEADDNDHPYGLYIAGDDSSEGSEGRKASAFIYGTLEAAVESGKPMFKADNEKMVFGMPRDDDENTRAFTVSQDGNIENYGSLDLAKDPANNEVKIGTLGGWEQAGNHSTHVNGSESENYYFHGRRLEAVTIATEVISDQNIASIMNESRFAVGSDSVDLSNRLSDEHKISGMSDLGTHVMIEGESDVKGPFVIPDIKDGEGNEISSSKIKYSNTNNLKFPVAVGSNMIVDGVLTARQMDAQNARMATLSAGSANLDDSPQGKWLNVDADGVKIGKAVDNDRSNGAYFSDEDIQIGTHWGNNGGSDKLLDMNKGAYLYMRANEHTADPYDPDVTIQENGTGGDIIMGNSAIKFEIKDSSRADDAGDGFGYGEVKIKNDNKKGSVVISDTNLTVMRQDVGANHYPVFSVRGNATAPIGEAADESVHGANNDPDPDSRVNDGYYDVAVHGKMLFTGKQEDIRQDVKYLSVGGREKHYYSPERIEYVAGRNDALVSIVYDGDGDSDKENILTINPKKVTVTKTEDGQTAEYHPYDDGRIYMRKGLIEATNSAEGSGESLNNATGVMMASRFVANNPQLSNHGRTTGKNYNVDLVREVSYEESESMFHVDDMYMYSKERKNDGFMNFYDTYMVNPAYTSVMNDIKLASRGGARLSDILPDFITKGIYLVTNGNNEGNGGGILTNEGGGSTYASAYLGDVPAPACPPGYGRVITVNPITFPVVAGGYVTKDGNGVTGVTSSGETVHADAEGNITLPDVLSTQLFRTYAATKKGNAPVSNTSPDINKWGILMGYTNEIDNTGLSTTNRDKYRSQNGVVYWNLIPIGKNTIEGYATTYCYLDRISNRRMNTVPYSDPMVGRDMGATPWATEEEKKYRRSLNDPQLKYDEVW